MMIRRLGALLAVAALFALGTYTEVGCGGLTTSPEPSGPTGDLFGTITDAAGGTAITNAQITVSWVEGGFTVPSNEQGRYSVFGIPTGFVVFEVRAPGYKTVRETVSIQEGENRKDVRMERG